MDPKSLKTGLPMVRGLRPMTFTYEGESITVDIPGWYGDDDEPGVHSGRDMEASDHALTTLKNIVAKRKGFQ